MNMDRCQVFDLVDKKDKGYGDVHKEGGHKSSCKRKKCLIKSLLIF